MKANNKNKSLIVLAVVVLMIAMSFIFVRIHLINESNSFGTDEFQDSIDNIFGIIRCKRICDTYGIEAEIDEVFEIKDEYEKFLKQVDLNGCETRDLAKIVYINNYLGVENEKKYINILKDECYNDHIGIYDTWAFKEYEEENIDIVKELEVNKVTDTMYIYKIFKGTELEEELLIELEIYDGLVRIYNETDNQDIKARIYATMFLYNITDYIDCSDVSEQFIDDFENLSESLINKQYVYSLSYYLSRNDWKLYDKLGIDSTVFRKEAEKWKFEDVDKSEWEYTGDSKNGNMLLLSGLYLDEIGIEDSIFLRKDFAKAYGQEITDYSNKYLVAEFSKLCEEYLDKQILFGI